MSEERTNCLEPAVSHLADAISEIVQMAVEERKVRRAREYRLNEIKDQIAQLEKEAEDLKEDWMFEPRWRTELRNRVESEIKSVENAEGEARPHEQPKENDHE